LHVFTSGHSSKNSFRHGLLVDVHMEDIVEEEVLGNVLPPRQFLARL
jgi:hypothetical protein